MTPIERMAHDIICIVKYGSPGGSAPTSDVKRVVDYMERAGLVKPILIAHDPKTAPVIGIVKYVSPGGSVPPSPLKLPPALKLPPRP